MLEGMEFFSRLFRSSRTSTSPLKKLTFLLMDGGSWMVRNSKQKNSSLIYLLFDGIYFLNVLAKLGYVFGTVFHVTDQNGNKLTDESVINYIEQVN